MSRFRTSNNQKITKGLFYETSQDISTVVYTLKDADHEINGVVYPSLYRLFMESDDPTEYRFAVEHMDGWDNWENLKEANWFKPFYAKWLKELEIRIKSQALHRLRLEAKSNSKNSFMANKFLIEKGWLTKEEAKAVGRPTKESIRLAAEDLFRSSLSSQDDLARISN